MSLMTEGYPVGKHWPPLLQARVILTERREEFAELGSIWPDWNSSYGGNLPQAYPISLDSDPYTEQFVATGIIPVAVRREDPNTIFHT
ncbi:MAG TPA: hypothetical protein VGO07_03910, partial [Candidatus Saccharimonadales bacterium]|nr:hypothetical protein [Candidatus Saccharimonadales bacterium]